MRRRTEDAAPGLERAGANLHSRSFSRWLLRLLLLSLAHYVNTSLEDSILGEIISLIFTLIAPGLLIWLPVLIIVGYLLKHATRFPNEFIGMVLLATAVVIALLYGIGATASETGAEKWVTIIVAYGLGQGFLLTFSTVFVYDVIHGAIKFIKRRKEAKEAKKEVTADEATA